MWKDTVVLPFVHDFKWPRYIGQAGSVGTRDSKDNSEQLQWVRKVSYIAATC